MSNYKGHIGGATVFCFAYVAVLLLLPLNFLDQQVSFLTNWQFAASLFVVAILFGLWPDVDTNSKAQDLFFGIAFSLDLLLILVGRLEAAAYLGLIGMLPIVGKHRGWTHTIWAMILIPLPIAVIPYLSQSSYLPFALMVYGAAVAGYLSHLVLDGQLKWR